MSPSVFCLQLVRLCPSHSWQAVSEALLPLPWLFAEAPEASCSQLVSLPTASLAFLGPSSFFPLVPETKQSVNCIH